MATEAKDEVDQDATEAEQTFDEALDVIAEIRGVVLSTEHDNHEKVAAIAGLVKDWAWLDDENDAEI